MYESAIGETPPNQEEQGDDVRYSVHTIRLTWQEHANIHTGIQQEHKKYLQKSEIMQQLNSLN